MNEMPRVKVLYIVGVGRSGSTILHNILGQIDQFFAVGEIRFLWDQGILEGRPCGCGEKIETCETWSKVLADAFGELHHEEIQRMADYNRRVRDRFSPFLFLPGHRQLIQSTLQPYITNIEKLYQSIQRQTGCRVIVDSSKSLFYAYILSLIPSIDLHIVHLVRDVRGVEYSLLKRKATGHERLQRHNPVKGALTWVLLNGAIELLGKRISRQHTMLRYEDFVSAPKAKLYELLTAIDAQDVPSPITDDNSVYLHPTHTVVGNGNRFRTGEIHLEADNLWQQHLSNKDKLLVSSMTLPLLFKYNYLTHAP